MSDPDVSAALDAASRDEEALLLDAPRERRGGRLDGSREPRGDRGQEGVGYSAACYHCRGEVEVAGALHEEGGPNLLAVWWCPACALAFDDAGIAAPAAGRAALTPGLVWYGRWRFRPLSPPQ